MIDRQRRIRGVELGKCRKRHLRASARLHIQIFERSWVLLKLRSHFQDHVILIQLGEDGRNLALSKGVVERVINLRRKDSQPRCSIAVDRQVRLQPAVLLVAGHVLQFRQSAQLVHQFRRQRVQFAPVGILHGVLKLGAAHPVLHRQVLHRLHEQRDAFDLCQLRLQPANDVRRLCLALLPRLQVDLDAPAVGREVRAIHSNERRQTLQHPGPAGSPAPALADDRPTTETTRSAAHPKSPE